MNLFELETDDDKQFVANQFATREGNWLNRIRLWLIRDKGFRPVGAGGYSDVFAHPGKSYVIKISHDSDEAYLRYAYYCKSHAQDNPILPKIFDIWSVHGYFLVVTEKLSPIGYGPFPSHLSDLIMSFIYWSKREYRLDPRKPQHYEDFVRKRGVDSNLDTRAYEWIKNHDQMLSALAIWIDKNGGGLDMKPDNMMKRTNGEIVITDPIT